MICSVLQGRRGLDCSCVQNQPIPGGPPAPPPPRVCQQPQPLSSDQCELLLNFNTYQMGDLAFLGEEV